jgi:DNA polymerase III subunit delta
LTMVTRQLRLIIISKDLGTDMTTEQIMTKLGITQDWKLDQLLRQARAYPLERIRRAYCELLETDMAIKTGKYDDDLAMDLLVVDMCKN